MNPTAAAMLSHEIEQDRRRALEARRHRPTRPERLDRPARHRRTSVWTMLLHMSLRMPRFGLAR